MIAKISATARPFSHSGRGEPSFERWIPGTTAAATMSAAALIPMRSRKSITRALLECAGVTASRRRAVTAQTECRRRRRPARLHSDDMTAFGNDIEQFLRECFELDPLRATAAGMHAHDARWPDVTEAGRLHRLEFGDRWDRRLPG